MAPKLTELWSHGKVLHKHLALIEALWLYTTNTTLLHRVWRTAIVHCWLFQRRKRSTGLTCPQRVKKEEELPDSSADIKGIKGIFKAAKLGQWWNQFQDIIFQILNHGHVYVQNHSVQYLQVDRKETVCNSQILSTSPDLVCQTGSAQYEFAAAKLDSKATNSQIILYQ